MARRNSLEIGFAQHRTRMRIMGWLAALGMLLAGPMSAFAAAKPPPLKVDLNAFDAMKKQAVRRKMYRIVV